MSRIIPLVAAPMIVTTRHYHFVTDAKLHDYTLTRGSVTYWASVYEWHNGKPAEPLTSLAQSYQHRRRGLASRRVNSPALVAAAIAAIAAYDSINPRD